MIKRESLESIAEILMGGSGEIDLQSFLLMSFPAVRFTFCSTDDIAVRKPVMVLPKHELYLYGGDHCLALTNDYDSAHGVVVADIDDEM
jgi:hypothetical protein